MAVLPVPSAMATAELPLTPPDAVAYAESPLLLVASVPVVMPATANAVEPVPVAAAEAVFVLLWAPHVLPQLAVTVPAAA